MLKAIELLKVIYADCLEWEEKGFATTYSTYELKLAIVELEALEIKDTQTMTREEARKLIDKHSKKDEFGVGVVSKKVAYIIADYLPKAK